MKKIIGMAINDFADINEDLLELFRIKTIKKGTIIALKGLCDHAIRKYNLVESSPVLIKTRTKK